jgi:hypothetical protein
MAVDRSRPNRFFTVSGSSPSWTSAAGMRSRSCASPPRPRCSMMPGGSAPSSNSLASALASDPSRDQPSRSPISSTAR